MLIQQICSIYLTCMWKKSFAHMPISVSQSLNQSVQWCVWMHFRFISAGLKSSWSWNDKQLTCLILAPCEVTERHRDQDQCCMICHFSEIKSDWYSHLFIFFIFFWSLYLFCSVAVKHFDTEIPLSSLSPRGWGWLSPFVSHHPSPWPSTSLSPQPWRCMAALIHILGCNQTGSDAVVNRCRIVQRGALG